MSHTDANGNNKLPTLRLFRFTKVPPAPGKDGKYDLRDGFQFFIADPEKHGRYFDEIVKRLNGYVKQPMYKMFTEDGFFKDRNPEAYKIAKEKETLHGEIDRLKNENDELHKRLGLKKQT
jgi:hypothetical protein